MNVSMGCVGQCSAGRRGCRGGGGKESGKDDVKEEEEESVKVEALVRQESDGVGEGTQQE